MKMHNYRQNISIISQYGYFPLNILKDAKQQQ